MKLGKLAMSKFEKRNAFGLDACLYALTVSSHKELEIAKVHYELTMQNKATDERLFTPSGFLIFREDLLVTLFVSRCSLALSCLCRASSHSELKSIQVIYVALRE